MSVAGGSGRAAAEFVPLGCALGDLRIVVEEGDPPGPTGEMLERWGEACAANPRLFNGPILRFRSFDRSARVIRASRETYQRYSMQRFDAATSTPERDIYHLAVTGVVLAGGEGRERVLLGKRGNETILYPGLWELAPGGGLETTDIYAQLLQEMEEELGLEGLVDGSRRHAVVRPPGPGDVLGLAIDPNSPSTDVVVRVRLSDGGEGALASSWEYEATRLVPLRSLRESVGEQGERSTIPPTMAVLRGLGWV